MISKRHHQEDYKRTGMRIIWDDMGEGEGEGGGVFVGGPPLAGGWVGEDLSLQPVLPIVHGSTVLNEWSGDEAALATVKDQQ